MPKENVFWSLILILGLGCSHLNASESVQGNLVDRTSEVEIMVTPSSPIDSLDYPQLFAMGMGEQLLSSDEKVTQLEIFVRNAANAPYERLLAAELLYRKQGYYQLDVAAMAELHAEAIKNARMHNPWGLPGEPYDFGESLLSLGETVESALKPLLTDTNKLVYFGSEEPTIAKMYNYRVADLAASLLAAKFGIPFIDNRNSAERDEWIKENF